MGERARKKAEENGQKSGKGSQIASRIVEAVDQSLNWDFASEEEIRRAFRNTPDGDEDGTQD